MSLLEPVAMGFAVGLVLGGVGGGGAILTVPVLVYMLNQPVAAATSSSLFVVGLGAVVGLASYASSRRVAYRSGVIVAGAGVPTSVLGSLLSPHIDEHVLMLCFSALMALAAAALLVRPVTSSRRQGPALELSETAYRGRVLAVGLVTGLLTGVLGVGGGFVLVPALVLVVGLPIDLAVGTSLLVIVCNSAVAAAARLGSTTAHLDPAVVVPFTAGVMVATAIGKSLAGRMPAVAISRTFAGLLLVVAAWSATQVVWPPSYSRALGTSPVSHTPDHPWTSPPPDVVGPRVASLMPWPRWPAEVTAVTGPRRGAGGP
jgi:uncharacterized membrane protein YfcA